MTSYLLIQHFPHNVCTLLLVVAVMVLVWFCLKDKWHCGIITETTKMGDTSQGECVAYKRKAGLSDASREDQYLKGRHTT